MNEITFLFIGLLILAFSVFCSQDGILDAIFDEDGKLYLHFNGLKRSEMAGVLVIPHREITNMDFTLSHAKAVSIDLCRNEGREMANLIKYGDFQAGFNSQQLDLPGTIADGVYFFRIYDGNNAVTIKIVK